MKERSGTVKQHPLASQPRFIPGGTHEIEPGVENIVVGRSLV